MWSSVETILTATYLIFFSFISNMEQILRPLPYKEKNISELDLQSPKVAISGIIVDKNPESLLLDDGVSQIRVITTEPTQLNSYVKVYGKLLSQEEIQGDIIQDISKIDKLLYNKVKNLLNKKEVDNNANQS